MLKDLLKKGITWLKLKRSQRRISDSPNMAESPEVPKFSLEGFTSGIRMPPLWFSKCLKGIHKIVKTCVVYTGTMRNSTHCIPFLWRPQCSRYFRMLLRL